MYSVDLPSWRCSRLKTLKVLRAIWLCRHVIWACHKKHSPHSHHGRVNSENSCASWSCARCCGPWFHSRRFLDSVKSLSQCVTMCPVLLKRKLQESILMCGKGVQSETSSMLAACEERSLKKSGQLYQMNLVMAMYCSPAA